MTYFRLLLGSKIVGQPEEISEVDAMKVLKEHWNNPYVLLEQGEPLTVNGYMYWREGD